METKTKLSAVWFGVAIGVTTGIFMMLFAWAGRLWGYGIPIIHDISSVYLGYAPSLVGGLLGGLWGFVDGFIFGIVTGWIYNLCVSCSCKKSSSPNM